MSYYPPPPNGPDGQWYDDYGIPAYHEQPSARHQNPSRIPQGRPPVQQHYAPDPRMRFPRPQAYPRAQPMEPTRHQYHEHQYQDTDYDDMEHDQWPLASHAMPAHEPSPPRRPAGARSGPPPRPQRPDYVPHPFEVPRQAPRAPSTNHPRQQPSIQQPPRSASSTHPYRQPPTQDFHHGTGQWTGDGYSVPTSMPPPQSQLQNIPQQPTYRHAPPRPPLGPPPSSRRGPSSYYSQMSPTGVHPIVEESESARFSTSRASLTSSNAIPIGIPRNYLDGRESGVSMTPSSIYPPDNSPPRHESPLRPFKQRMHETTPDEYFPPQAMSTPRDESPDANVPVRQASLGKRSKPTLTTVKSGDRLQKRGSASSVQQKRDTMDKAPTSVPRQAERDAVAGSDRIAPSNVMLDDSPTAPPPRTHANGSDGSKVSFFDSSSESVASPTPIPPAQLDSPRDSIRLVNTSNEKLGVPNTRQQGRGPSPLAHEDSDDEDDFENDAHSKEMLADPEKRAGLAREDSDTLKPAPVGYSESRAGRRRPPRLNVDAVRDEEARGSLTSLSDLIKRATKLASNLDRGRTASRLGMEHWLKGANGSGELGEKQRRQSSLSDILASFPPPRGPTPAGKWSNRRRSEPLRSNSDSGSHTRKQRRCCGIPLWMFMLLMVILFFLVAAATVIPIVLIVVPNSTNSSSSSNGQANSGIQASTLSRCAAKLTCANGGQAFPLGNSTSSNQDDDGGCRCLCVNSFTGPTCSSKSTAGCSSISVPGMDQNATIGDAIPRLLALAKDKYSLPLDSRALMAQFNEADLSCVAENALVSFNGKAQRRSANPTQIMARSPQATPSSIQPVAATSNGIVYDSSAPTPTAPSQSPQSATPTSSASATPTASLTNDDLDFARAAVLYILQASSSLQEAESAQKALQGAFDGGAAASVVDVGGEWRVDLDGMTVRRGMGGS